MSSASHRTTGAIANDKVCCPPWPYCFDALRWIVARVTLEEIVRYTATADRKRLAKAAMEKMKTRTFTVKPNVKFDKKRKFLRNQSGIVLMVPRGGYPPAGLMAECSDEFRSGGASRTPGRVRRKRQPS
jgi:hypothetical protein